MKSEGHGASKEIWLHLLKAGEWQTVPEIKQALPELVVSNLSASLDDMARAGTVSFKKQGLLRAYAVVTTSRISRGITLKELMGAMPSLAANDSNRRAA
jgi:hypothetical protein